jgi:hypothetical protein
MPPILVDDVDISKKKFSPPPLDAPMEDATKQQQGTAKKDDTEERLRALYEKLGEHEFILLMRKANPDLREKMVKQLQDQDNLKLIVASTTETPEVRGAAVGNANLNDLKFLAKVAENEKEHHFVRLMAEIHRQILMEEDKKKFQQSKSQNLTEPPKEKQGTHAGLVDLHDRVSERVFLRLIDGEADVQKAQDMASLLTDEKIIKKLISTNRNSDVTSTALLNENLKDAKFVESVWQKEENDAKVRAAAKLAYYALTGKDLEVPEAKETPKTT